MNTLQLSIDGMRCGGCVRRVSSVLGALPGVTVQNVVVGSAVVTVDPGLATAESVVAALARAGYRVLTEASDERH